MKAEDFDQYVRAQFESETVAPPAALEGAVFASLAAENRKRRGIAAAAILLVVTSATTLWLNAPEPVQPEVTESAPAEMIVPVAGEPAIAVEPSAARAEPVVSEASTPNQTLEPKASATTGYPAQAQPMTSAPAVMDQVISRDLSGIEQEDAAQPQLQQLEGEKWVLPATVTVKD